MSRKKTHEEFVSEIAALVGNEYTVKGTYTNSTTPVKLLHNICERTFSVRPNNFLHGTGARSAQSTGQAKEDQEKQMHSSGRISRISSETSTRLKELIRELRSVLRCATTSASAHSLYARATSCTATAARSVSEKAGRKKENEEGKRKIT